MEEGISQQQTSEEDKKSLIVQARLDLEQFYKSFCGEVRRQFFDNDVSAKDTLLQMDATEFKQLFSDYDKEINSEVEDKEMRRRIIDSYFQRFQLDHPKFSFVEFICQKLASARLKQFLETKKGRMKRAIKTPFLKVLEPVGIPDLLRFKSIGERLGMKDLVEFSLRPQVRDQYFSFLFSRFLYSSMRRGHRWKICFVNPDTTLCRVAQSGRNRVKIPSDKFDETVFQIELRLSEVTTMFKPFLIVGIRNKAVDSDLELLGKSFKDEFVKTHNKKGVMHESMNGRNYTQLQSEFEGTSDTEKKQLVIIEWIVNFLSKKFCRFAKTTSNVECVVQSDQTYQWDYRYEDNFEMTLQTLKLQMIDMSTRNRQRIDLVDRLCLESNSERRILENLNSDEWALKFVRHQLLWKDFTRTCTNMGFKNIVGIDRSNTFLNTTMHIVCTWSVVEQMISGQETFLYFVSDFLTLREKLEIGNVNTCFQVWKNNMEYLFFTEDGSLLKVEERLINYYPWWTRLYDVYEFKDD